ncbi:MAG: zf-HC2 domain-containing protein [Phycisphaerales bacterium]|nr:MAG: zf-HC2 domain-containing protein [Phycisphaerales bacterium]
MNCETVREELPALLYDELEDTVRQRVEEHLRQCEACRAELTGYRRAMHMLDEWSEVERPSQPRRERAIRPGRRGWRRVGPAVVGAAAAAIAFAVLSLLGLSVSYNEGRLLLTFGSSPDVRPGAPDEAFAEHLPALRTAVQEAMDTRIATLLEGLETDLVEIVNAEGQRQLLLVHALDQRRETDLRQFAAAVDVLVQRQEEETQRAQRFQADMMAWRTSMENRLPQTTDKQEPKEKS